MQIFTILLLTVLASRHRERKELAKILEKQFKKYDGIKCEIKKKKHHRKCERECVSQQNNGCCSPCSPCCQGLGCSNCCNKTQTCECRKCRKCPTTGQTNCCSPCCKPCSPCCQGAGCSNCCNKTQTCEQRRCGRCPEPAQNGCGSSSCSPCCQGGGCSNCCNKTQTCKCRKCRKCPTTGQNNCCSPCCKPCSPCCQGAGCSNCCNKTQVCEKKKKHCKKSKKHCHRRRCECQPQPQQGCSPCSPCSPCCQQGMAPALMAPLFAPAPAAAPFMANPAPFVNAAQFSSTATGTEAPLAGQQSAPLQEGSYGEETITRTASGQERITCNPARTLADQPCSSLSKISPCSTSICQKGVQALSLTQQNLLGNPLRNIASLFPCLQQYPCIQQLLARTANTPFSLPLFQGCLDELNKIIDSKEAVQTLPKQPSKLDKIIHEVSLGNVVMKELFDYIKNAVPIKSTDPAAPQPIDPAVPQPIDTTVPKPIDTTDSIQPTTNDTNFDKIIDKLDALEKKLDNIDPSVLDSLLKFQSTTEEKLKTMEEIQEREYYENQERSDKMNKLLQDISDQVKENTKSLDKNRADINRNGSILSDFESQIDLLNKEVSELKNKIDKTKDEIENLKKGTGIGGGN